MKYSATFSNGKTLTRTSTREYRTAWMVWDTQGRVLMKGFAYALDPAIPRYHRVGRYCSAAQRDRAIEREALLTKEVVRVTVL